MTSKKDLIIAVLITFCLTATLFTIVPTKSGNGSSYDPWKDLNDDGVIDSTDLGMLGTSWATTGDPVNKTALLLELQAKIESLNASLLNLEAYLITRITDLETMIAQQQTRISELETQLSILNATKLGKPDYDSFEDPEVGGWRYLQPDVPWRFDHHLNTTNVIVYLVFSNDSIGTNINHHWYGGQNSGTWWGGAWWSELTKDYIMVTRYAHSNECAYVRVMIWKIPG
jgi:hypothetical protein